MLVTNWEHVLNTLLNAAEAGGHEKIRCDILQLQDLTEEQGYPFLPIRCDEVTDQETARRIINYADLIEEIINKLVQTGVFSRGRRYHDFHYIGRGLTADDSFDFWLGIAFDHWTENGKTPLWCSYYYAKSGIAGQDIANSIPESIDKESEGNIYIPIFLLTGVEKERVIEHAVNQMHDIADTLKKIVQSAGVSDST